MDWAEIIGGIISFILMTGLYYIAGKGTFNTQTRTKEGTYFLRNNKIYYYIGVFSCSLVLIAPIVTAYFDPSQIIFAFIVTFLCFGIAGAYLILFYKNGWLEFNEHTFRSGTLFGKPKTINWEDVKDISFNKGSGYIKLKSENETIKVHFHMVGLVYFLAMIKKCTDFKPADLGITV